MDEQRPDRQPSLWRQIGASVLVAYLLATAVAGALLAYRLQAVSAEQAETSLRADVALLRPTMRRALLEGDTERMHAITAVAKRIADRRVTVIRPDGEVAAESERALPLGNHADRPEFIDAMRDGTGRSERLSTTVGTKHLYLGERLDDDAGRPLGVLRVSAPLEAFAALVHKLWGAVILALLLGVPVASLVGWIAARRIARPIEDITAAATRMAAGDFQAVSIRERDDVTGRLSRALASMREEIRTTLETSESDRAELGAILGSMVEGVLALDDDERVLRANEGVARCLGLTDTPAPGAALASLAPVPALSEHVRRALAGEDLADTDVTLPGMRTRVLNISAAPIRGMSGAVNGAVVVLRDVSALRRLERARLDFIANVSHELRTPVAAVLGALETVRDLEPHEVDARDRLIDTAFRNGERLSNLVNDLLALSAIEAEVEQVDATPVPLLRAVRATIGNLQAVAARQGIELVGPGPDATSVHVTANEGRLEMVWTNLVENALKYTPRGGRVTVTVDAESRPHEAAVTVEDSGHGIPEKALPRIFERFYRVDKARSRSRGGTGLGLAIVKHVVAAHRGRVDVESEVGSGSTFRVWLPLHRS